MRRAMRASDPKQLGTDSSLNLPEADSDERQLFIFYQDDGGLRATNELNQSLDNIYYLGIIDILTPYNMKKRLEHVWKGLSADIVSLLPPISFALNAHIYGTFSTK